MALLYIFSRPIFYLFIKDPSKEKKWIDWILPFISSSLIFLLLSLLSTMPTLIGENGVLQNLKGFLQIMPGFYLTALAAIATFSNKTLDLALPDPTPTISISYNGYKIKEMKLTRRRFLNYLFGYLTTLSLFLYFSIIIAELFCGSYFTKNLWFQILIKPVLSFVFLLFVFQMLSITIFGLYQLCERMHQVETKEKE